VTARPARQWQEQAACADYGPGVMTPEEESAAAPRSALREAAAICARCPVASECLEFALDAEAGVSPQGRAGVYGGRSPMERYRIHQRRAQAALNALV
jgi:WhiB family redox-sensing transcriptional regulator